jgi:tetratricopeptide (TPR) repeat protein
MTYRGLGQMDEARAHLARRGTGSVRVADPVVDGLDSLMRGERAFVLQGRRAYEARQYGQAVDAFRKAVAAAPSSAASRVNLALALAQVGNVEAAVEQYERVLTLDAANPEAQAGAGQLIRTLLTASRDDQAVQLFTRVRAFPIDDEDATVHLSVALAARERYRDAISLLEESHRTYPDRPSTETTLARLLAASPDLSLRNGQRAFDLATAVYGRAPLPVYGETVAMALAEQGRCEEAAEWMKKAIASADAARDAAETVRLKGESARYAARPCRP